MQPDRLVSSPLYAAWQRGITLLGSRYPIVGGAMSWVSERHLVAALSNAGAFGVLACGSMPPALLQEEIRATRRLTDRPFGVNIILMHPERDALIACALAEGVRHIILAGGIPRRPMVDAIHAAGAYALSFAPTLSVAQRLVDYGMDGLILEGSEAGGHIGPVSTSVLAQEILPALADRVPVWMAGGIGHGAMIAHYMRLGAVGCQIGTMFVCAEESIAHPNFKQAFIEAQARDAQASVQLDPDFPVIPVRALKNKASEDFLRFQQQALAAYRQGIATKEDTQLSIEHYWAGALRRAVMEGDMEHGSLMAGQSVGMVRAIEPAAMIVQRLVDEACRAAGV